MLESIQPHYPKRPNDRIRSLFDPRCAASIRCLPAPRMYRGTETDIPRMLRLTDTDIARM